MKKSLYCIVSLILWLWFVWAQSLSLIPEWDGNFWNNCLVPIDVFVDTQGQEVATMDLVMETSLEYKDFVPTDLLPYFFPPIIDDKWLIHIGWFAVDQSERINWSGKIWTLYFGQKNNDIDGVVRLYFLGEWNTVDTNLGKIWWIDVLNDVLNAYVVFSSELEPCKTIDMGEGVDENSIDEIDSEYVISWGFADKTQEEALQETLEKIEAKYGKTSWDRIKNTVYIVVLLLLLLLIVLLLIYKNKNILSSEKESGKWKSKPKHKRK